MLTSILDDFSEKNEPTDSKRRNDIENDFNNNRYIKPQNLFENINEYQIETNETQKQPNIIYQNKIYENKYNLNNENNNSSYNNNSKFYYNKNDKNINTSPYNNRIIDNNKKLQISSRAKIKTKFEDNSININYLKNQKTINSIQLEKENINNPSIIRNNNKELTKIEYEIKDNKIDNLKKNEYYIKYVTLNRQGFEYIRERNYLSALTIFKNSYELAKNYLNDSLKEINSLINISICEYYNGNFSESYTMINKAKIIYDSIPLNEKNISSKQKIQLILKLFLNSSLSNLSINNYNESKNDILYLISTIRKETKIEQQFLYFRTILLTLFKVNSLIDYDSLEDDSSDNLRHSNIDSDITEPIKIINHLMKDFLLFLKEKNYNNLLKTFKETSEKYIRLNDFNGYYFSLFYYYLVLYNLKKNNSEEFELENIKNEISKCNNNLIRNELVNNIKEKDINKLLKEFIDKMDCASEIYLMLENFENELNNKLNEYKKEKDNIDLSDDENNLSFSHLLDKSHLFTNEKINSPIFVKILLRYSINFLENQKENILQNSEINNINLSKENYDILLNEVKLMQQKIENNEINIENIKLHHLDKEMINSLKQLFDNLIYIYSKSKLNKYFKIYRQKIKKIVGSQKLEKVLDFLMKSSKKLNNGLYLVKINYKTKGYKVHFYNIDVESHNFNVRNKENDYPSAFYNIKIDILKVLYGLKSPNLISKLKEDNYNECRKFLQKPWNLLSIITKKRSIDLYCENDQIDTMFYGLKSFFIDKKILYKINSTNYFVLNKIKLKIAIKLKNKYIDKKTGDKSKIPPIITELINESGIQKISFTKLILIYNKYK